MKLVVTTRNTVSGGKIANNYATDQENGVKSSLFSAMSDFMEAYNAWIVDESDDALSHYREMKTYLLDELEGLDDEHLREMLSDDEIPIAITSKVKDVLRNRDESVRTQKLFEKVRGGQGHIEPVTKKAKVDALSFVNTEKRFHPMLSGVFHSGGYVVGSNGHVLYAKRNSYPTEHEGKVTDKVGVNIEGKYPNWKGVKDSILNACTVSDGIDVGQLLGFVDGVLTQMKVDKVKRSEQEQAVVMLKDDRGQVHGYRVSLLQKVLNGAGNIGSHSVRINRDGYLYANTEEGFVTITPVVVDDSAIDNMYAYVARES